MYFPGYRFSEDLDFTAGRDVTDERLAAKPRLMEASQHAGVHVTRLERLPTGRGGWTLKVRYADMNGHPNHLLVQMSLREAVRLPAEPRRILDPYEVVPKDARIPTMDLREILAEKLRSLLMRSQARDLYDLWFLLKEGVAVDVGLVEAKLDWWKKGLSFDPRETEDRLDRLEATWHRDLDPLLAQVPSFETVSREVRGRLAEVRRGPAPGRCRRGGFRPGLAGRSGMPGETSRRPLEPVRGGLGVRPNRQRRACLPGLKCLPGSSATSCR